MLTAQEPPSLSRGKRIAFGVVTFLLVWLVVDTATYVALQVIGSRFGIFYGLRTPTDQEISDFARIGFHPVFGWDLRRTVEHGPLGEKKGHPYTLETRYKAKAFGDSFTEGIRDPKTTFEYYVEEETGWPYLNFGVSGFGPDQALLKYQATTVSSEYVTLGLVDENIGRIVNVLRGFYTLEESYRTKPRYIVGQDGKVVLLPNPITRAGDLSRLKDAQFVERLSANDYWRNYYKRLNAPERVRWPATAVIVPHLDFFVSQSFRLAQHALRPTFETNMWRSRHYHLYDPGSEGIKILDHIMDEFVSTAEQRGEVPIVLVFAGHETMQIMRDFGKKPYQSLVDHLRSANIEFIDYGDVFLRQPDWESYYIPNDGHFFPRGNQKVADEIVKRIRLLDDRQSRNRS